MKSLRPLLVLVIVGLLSACQLPASGVTPPVTESDLIYTQAVETVSAELTSSAQGTPQAAVEDKATATEPAAPLQEATPDLPAATATPQPTTEPVQAEATATEAPTAAPTVLPSATLPGTDPRAALGSPDFADPFDTAENWPLYKDDHGSFEIADGKLTMTAFEADFYNVWMLSWPVLEDFYLEASMSAEQCAERDRYGLIFRAPDSNQGYLFGFSCDGRYSLWYWDGKKEIDVIDWTANTNIQVGVDKVNRIGVRAVGKKIALYANGVLLKEVENSQYLKGDFGVFIGAAYTEDFSAFVDKIEYWELE